MQGIYTKSWHSILLDLENKPVNAHIHQFNSIGPEIEVEQFSAFRELYQNIFSLPRQHGIIVKPLFMRSIDN